MAITTNKTLNEIYRIIRKGSFQFEPDDRIPIVYSNSTRKMTLYLGSVYYDNATSNVCYDLYNHVESPMPVGALAPRRIEKLSVEDLLKVAGKLNEYEKYSLIRHSNYRALEQAVEASPSGNIDFSEQTKPRVLVTPEMFADAKDAKFEEYKVKTLFKDTNSNECYVSLYAQDTVRNVRLALLNDRSIMNINTCVKSMQSVQDQKANKGISF